ncbi:glycosyltransferase family 4 protein [Paenibacillus chungangensis]|uniref:Glycosyltransferase family 4 protein n=1 Tax=Paenibacillus chungangensis TaxID=696535 RepID=A0ABW3HL17_9BACL
MKVWMWPKSSPLNRYNDLLSDSLGEAGIEVMDLEHGRLMLKIGRAKPGDTIHIHWIHHAYQHSNLLVFAFKSLILILTMLYLRLWNIGLVWTIHNLYPHQMKYARLERWMRSLICRMCTGMIVASESIKRKAVKEFGVPPAKLHVVKHGHYLDVYKPQGICVRKQYGIDEKADVFLFMGAIKAYKGVEDLIEAFNAMKTRDTHLIIAGKADEEQERYLRRMEDADNIVLRLGFVPNEEVADLVRAADALVLPYKEITTSGSAILGLSFQKLVVMPDNEFVNEYFREGMVVTYDPAKPGALDNALMTARSAKYGQRTSRYEEALRELDWSVIAQQTKRVYRTRAV